MNQNEIKIAKEIAYLKRKVAFAIKEIEGLEEVPVSLRSDSDKALILAIKDEIRIFQAEIHSQQKKLPQKKVK